jgi:predicted GNAT family acetyltransferase
MENSVELFNEVKSRKQEYLKNKSLFVSAIERKYRESGCYVRPTSVYFEVGDTNDMFTYICENKKKLVKQLSKSFHLPKDFLMIDCNVTNSIVDTQLRIHPYIHFVFGNGMGYVSICPLGDTGIEISQVKVDDKMRSQGLGSVMMCVVMCVLTNHANTNSEYNLNQIMLECVGSIGMGETRVETTISKQTKFFRKFGFRVIKDRKNKYGELMYVQMNYDETKFDIDDVINTMYSK